MVFASPWAASVFVPGDPGAASAMATAAAASPYRNRERVVVIARLVMFVAER